MIQVHCIHCVRSLCFFLKEALSINAVIDLMGAGAQAVMRRMGTSWTLR